MADPEPPHGEHLLSIGRVVVVAASIPAGNMSYGADLYKWVDENGVAHLSDQEPTSERGRYEVIRGKDETPDASAARPDAETGPDTAAARGGMPDLYTKETYRCSAFFDAETGKAIEHIRAALLSADGARVR